MHRQLLCRGSQAAGQVSVGPDSLCISLGHESLSGEPQAPGLSRTLQIPLANPLQQEQNSSFTLGPERTWSLAVEGLLETWTRKAIMHSAEACR